MKKVITINTKPKDPQKVKVAIEKLRDSLKGCNISLEQSRLDRLSKK